MLIFVRHGKALYNNYHKRPATFSLEILVNSNENYFFLKAIACIKILRAVQQNRHFSFVEQQLR